MGTERFCVFVAEDHDKLLKLYCILEVDKRQYKSFYC